MPQAPPSLIHWAETTAHRIMKQCGDKEVYTLAAGMTPSGTIHFGNFREVITVDFVARALKARGKSVRFLFSWDDYDTFRKVPANLPEQEKLTKHLFLPIVDVPDPHQEAPSYAAYHERTFEEQLKRVDINPEFLYQADKYRKGEYRDAIVLALDKSRELAEILNAHRMEPLPPNWLPLGVYCQQCGRDDKIEHLKRDNEKLSYHCKHCQQDFNDNIATSTRIKLPWRIDWPMRWSREKVDFEPGGKDHSALGGSYTTAKKIVHLFNWRPPVYLQYDFVSIKGGSGKMSSSSGEVVTLSDVLKVYTPEMVRWIFARFKPNLDFSISFDLDVIKTYEDYDRQELLATGQTSGNPKKIAMAKRVFALSRLSDTPEQATPPFRPGFRHLTNILQINQLSLKRTEEFYRSRGKIKNSRDEQAFQERAACARYWIEHHAPEDFKFSLNTTAPAMELSPVQRKFLTQFMETLSLFQELPEDKELHESIYKIIEGVGADPKDIFALMYRLLISKDRGPKLAGFICTIGKEKTLQILGSVKR